MVQSWKNSDFKIDSLLKTLTIASFYYYEYTMLCFDRGYVVIFYQFAQADCTVHFFPKIVKHWLKLSNVQRISTSQACKDKLQEGQEQPFAMKGKWEAIKMTCLSVKLPSLMVVLFLVLAKDQSLPCCETFRRHFGNTRLHQCPSHNTH